MDLMEAIRTRRSIRSYQNRPVEEDKIQGVLEADGWHPPPRTCRTGGS